jgi:hypothetical protein
VHPHVLAVRTHIPLLLDLVTGESRAKELGEGTLTDAALPMVRALESGQRRLGSLGTREKRTGGGRSALLSSTDQLAVALLKTGEEGGVLRLEASETEAARLKLLAERGASFQHSGRDPELIRLLTAGLAPRQGRPKGLDLGTGQQHLGGTLETTALKGEARILAELTDLALQVRALGIVALPGDALPL